MLVKDLENEIWIGKDIHFEICN